MAPIDEYFARVNPTYSREAAAGPLFAQANLYRAWNLLSRQLFYTSPRALDRTRFWRNRFIRAVQ